MNCRQRQADTLKGFTFIAEGARAYDAKLSLIEFQRPPTLKAGGKLESRDAIETSELRGISSSLRIS